MKKFSYNVLVLFLLMACQQDVIDLKAPETPPAGEDPCETAVPGSANFSKFVAIGTSYTEGFQAGALFTEGQENSLGKILATQFACVGGGAFNQPDIRTQNGFNIFITPNPMGAIVLGRFKLQGTPPTPQPVISGVDAIPNPQANPGFMYTGSEGAVAANELNNFSVHAMLFAQALALTETGDWTKADIDPGTPGAQPHPYFNPFYARFASNPGTSTLFGDAVSSLTNGGTFFLFWLGMDDFLLHAAFGGDESKAPLTPLEFESASNPGFKYFYNNAMQGLLANPTLKGVVVNYPDIFIMPHFTAVPWNAIAFTAADQATIDATNGAYAAYNGGLDQMLMGGYPGLTADEVAKRKIAFHVGPNGAVIEDETLTDLTSVGLPSIRQATSSDLLPLSAGAVLGTEATPGDPTTTWGVGKALTDQYALIPAEISEISNTIAAYNAFVKETADTYSDRLAFADVNTALKNLAESQAAVVNGVTITANIDPPTGLFSEEGLHPNARGYAFIANTIIDAINAKFGSTVQKANMGAYGATSLPINP